MFSNYQRDPLTTHAPDILIHLCSFLSSTMLMELWKTNKLFNLLISDKVPVVVRIKSLSTALMLISMFKKVQLHLQSNPYHILVGYSAYDADFAMIQDRDLQIIGKYVTRLYILFEKCCITKKGFDCLINLKKLTANNHSISTEDLDILRNRGVECILRDTYSQHPNNWD